MLWLVFLRYLFFIFYIFIATVIISDINLISYQEKNLFAYAHIFTDTPNTITKNIDSYQIVFLPYPNIPLANDNSTRLNFSLTENKTDVYNVFVSLIIKEKSSGNVIEQIPYKFYEFGDITFPHTFQKVGDYIVTLQARINGDSKYQVNPLIANFDISVVKSSEILFIGWIAVLIPILAAIPGIVVYMFFKRESNNENNNSIT
jgi:hypothetical protein